MVQRGIALKSRMRVEVLPDVAAVARRAVEIIAVDAVRAWVAIEQVGMSAFGASAPLKEPDRHFGFEPDRVSAIARELLGSW